LVASEDRNIAKTKKTRRNQEIDAPQVRLIDESGEQKGIIATVRALEYAQDVSLDLVEVSPNAAPPVCRVMDFGKYVFEKNKSQQAAKRKQKQVQIKEIKFRPGTDEGDYQIKLRNLIRFLQEGDRAKVTLRFRGREMQHQELGRDLLERVRDDLSEYASVESFPRMEGRQMVMMLAPHKS
jgi:translation initiation factor IF-3